MVKSINFGYLEIGVIFHHHCEVTVNNVRELLSFCEGQDDSFGVDL